MISSTGKTPVIQIIKAISFCLLFVALLFLFSPAKNFLPLQYERYWYGLIGTMAALLSTWSFLKLDKRSFASIGLRYTAGTVPRFFVGLAIGLLMASIMTGGLILFTGLKLEPVKGHDLISILFWSLSLIPLAYMEELAFRGYAFVTIRSAAGIRAALVVTAILFALYHFIGGQPLASSFIGPGVWAFVFGLATMMSGGIALPTGLHFGANLILVLIGQKKQYASIYTVEYSNGADAAVQQQAELTGNMIQFVLFIIAVVVMERYVRKEKKLIK